MGDGDLARKLRALLLFRIVVASALLGATALVGARAEGGGARPTEALLYSLVAVVYGLSAAYALGLRVARSGPGLRRLAYVQLTGDALFAAILVLITGGTASVFTFFFSLWIVLAAILLYRAGALYVATASALLLLGIALLEMGALGSGSWLDEALRQGVGPFRALDVSAAGAPAYGAVAYNLIVNVVAFYLVAFLSSYLADQLRRTDLELQENQVSLEDLRALHENIVSSIQSGLVTVNRNRQITFFNQVAEEITGYRAGDLVYKDITRYFTDLKAIFQNEDKLLSKHEEVTCQVLGGKLAYLKWTITPLRDARETPIGHILSFEDVTRVRQMEDQMKRAEQLATLGKLAPAIAHEIRNPLASISGSIQLLRNTLELSDVDRRLMDIVSRETDALNKWITDFLTYARPRHGERVRVDMREIVGDALTVLKHDEKSANIAVELDAEEEAPVLGDPTYLKQVAWNILNNAVQAMPEGGTLRVAIDRVEDERGELRRLRFTDTGAGIPPDALERVFEPFFTTKESGTGLGLATVFRIVTDHAGFVSVTSAKGTGTTFTVELPAWAGEEAWPKAAALRPTGTSDG